MQIVIDIPKVMYNNAKRDLLFGADILVNAVKNGTPLPKGHGKLIDADVLGEKLNRYTEAPYQYALAVFNESPTIIEADKGDKE